MKTKEYLSIRQFCKKYPEFKESSVRYYISTSKKNGFERAFLRLGWNILIKEKKFLDQIKRRKK